MTDAPPHGILTELGLNGKLLMAGFAGGMLQAFMLRSSDPWTIIGSVIAGVFSANYFGATLGFYLQHVVSPDEATGMGGFIAGICAMTLAQAIRQAVLKAFKRRFGVDDDPKPV